MSADTIIEETDRFLPVFNKDGLIPCIATDAGSGAVLMLAWMNEESLGRTLDDYQRAMASTSRERGLIRTTLYLVSPALAAALHDATGIWFDELPLTPERVLAGLAREQDGQAAAVPDGEQRDA